MQDHGPLLPAEPSDFSSFHLPAPIDPDQMTTICAFLPREALVLFLDFQGVSGNTDFRLASEWDCSSGKSLLSDLQSFSPDSRPVPEVTCGSQLPREKALSVRLGAERPGNCDKCEHSEPAKRRGCSFGRRPVFQGHGGCRGFQAP